MWHPPPHMAETFGQSDEIPFRGQPRIAALSQHFAQAGGAAGVIFPNRNYPAPAAVSLAVPQGQAWPTSPCPRRHLLKSAPCRIDFHQSSGRKIAIRYPKKAQSGRFSRFLSCFRPDFHTSAEKITTLARRPLLFYRTSSAQTPLEATRSGTTPQAGRCGRGAVFHVSVIRCFYSICRKLSVFLKGSCHEQELHAQGRITRTGW